MLVVVGRGRVCVCAQQEMGRMHLFCVTANVACCPGPPEACKSSAHALKRIMLPQHTHIITHAVHTIIHFTRTQTRPQMYFAHVRTHALRVMFLLGIMGVLALNIKAGTSTFICCWNKVVEISSACHNTNTHTHEECTCVPACVCAR